MHYKYTSNNCVYSHTNVHVYYTYTVNVFFHSCKNIPMGFLSSCDHMNLPNSSELFLIRWGVSDMMSDMNNTGLSSSPYWSVFITIGIDR